MTGLLQDIAAVLAFNSLSATLVTAPAPPVTSDAHQISSGTTASRLSSSGDPSSSKSGLQQQQAGAGCAAAAAGAPLQQKSHVGVQAMVALQEVLAPLLHYLSMHQMWALSRLLCGHIKTAAHHTAAGPGGNPAAACPPGERPAAAAGSGAGVLPGPVEDDTDYESDEEEVAGAASGSRWLRLLHGSLQALGLWQLFAGHAWRGPYRSDRMTGKGVGGSGLLRQRLKAQASNAPGSSCAGAAPEVSPSSHLPSSCPVTGAPPAESEVALVAAGAHAEAPGSHQVLPLLQGSSQGGGAVVQRLLRCACVLLATAFCAAGLELTRRQVGLPHLLGAPCLRWLQ
jgi:hypothetical protein